MKDKNKYPIYIILLFLGLLSIINLYNAKLLNTFYRSYYIKQTIFYLIGFLIIFICKNKNLNFLFKNSFTIYIINIALLVLVLFIGKAINGTRAWIDLGIFSLQPSEFMKFSLSLFLINNLNKKTWKLILYTFIPSLLVFLEPDTGAIIFYLIILFVVLLYKKIKLKHLLFLIGSFISLIIIFFILYFFNQNILIKLIGTSFFYRVERIINFKANNYQLDLAMLSIFSNNFIRNGFGNILIYIPEGTTDFILAFMIGNFGHITFYILLILYYLLIKYLFKLKINNKKTNYLLISFITMFIVQSFINISMNLGIIPTIGITLPFLSYGGSSIILYFIYIATFISFSKGEAHS